MNLQYGLKGEAYKAIRGFDTHRETAKLFCVKHIRLLAARNQSAAFQLVLAADEDFLLSIGEQACFDKRGQVSQVRLQAEMDGGTLGCSMSIVGFVQDDDGLKKADILLNDRSVSVERNTVQPVWVEIEVPRQCPAGNYRGRVALFSHTGFSAEKRVGEVSFELDVKDFTLPDPRDYRFHLDLWQHNSNLARKHETPLWSDGHFAVMEQYVSSLAKLGQKAVSVVVSEIPWSGQFCYRNSVYPSDLYEYSMVRVRKNRAGMLETDFSALDRYVDLCFQYGIDREIEVFGLLNIWICEEEGFGRAVPELSDGVRVRYLDERDGCYKFIGTADELVAYIQSLERHFVERGLIDRVRVVADEPADMETFAARMAFLRKAAPRLQYKAAVDHAGFIGAFRGEIADFIPDFTALCKAYAQIKRQQNEIWGRLCWYVCCGPELPNTFIRSHLAECFAIGPLTEYMGLAGFLRWGYTAWPERPRERISYLAHVWPAGDTCFVYPSPCGGPLLTLRYKALLKGIQMFELMQALKETDGDAGEKLARIFSMVFRFGGIDDFNPSMRQRVGDLIRLEDGDWLAAQELLLDWVSSPEA